MAVIFDFWNIHWLYCTQILFVVTAALMVVISLLSRPPDTANSPLHLVWRDAAGEGRDACKLERLGCGIEPDRAGRGRVVLRRVLVSAQAETGW